MKCMKKVYFLVWMCLWGLTGCSDFLEEDSKENTYATSCSDLNELLVGSGYMEHRVVFAESALRNHGAGFGRATSRGMFYAIVEP